MKTTIIAKRWPIGALVLVATVLAGVSCLSPGQKTEVPIAIAPLPTPLQQPPLPPKSPAAEKTAAPTSLPAKTGQPPSVAPVSQTPSPSPAVSAIPSPSPAGAVTRPDPQSGEKTFYSVGCIGCHTVQGIGGRVGPELTGVAERKGVGYVRESIKQPRAFIVPGFPPNMPSPAELEISDQDIENIIAWLQTTK